MSNRRGGRGEPGTEPASADLTYMAPDQLRFGSVGVFAGEWAWYGNPPRVPVGFVGTLVDRLNGWAVFSCTREVAEAIVADNDRRRRAEKARLIDLDLDVAGPELAQRVDQLCPPLRFDGDVIVFDESALHEGNAITRYVPDGDGRYRLDGDSWCWQAIDPGYCDRIAGVVPAREAAQEYVMAVHSPLRMPHGRLAVTAMQHAWVSDGIAYTASLHLDGQYVGMIENKGGGVATVYHTAGRGFGWRELNDFVAACRWQEGPVSEDAVLEALISEFEISKVISEYEPHGEALVALRGDDGSIINIEYRLDKWHMATGDPQQMATTLTRKVAGIYNSLDSFTWQFWWDGCWRTLGTVDAAMIRDATRQ
ncbi:hypothetical protein AB0B66_10610 [Catellatospora sp. NPDC049111]|uniref:hypothetical protein n=1 Tax=Catellatospora sp. NPDC049111 TaxID=3155271 RepID=UPI00340CDB54